MGSVRLVLEVERERTISPMLREPVENGADGVER